MKTSEKSANKPLLDAATKQRLGFAETAGLADIITGLLDSVHKHIRNAIDVGAGNKNVELPSAESIRDAYHRGTLLNMNKTTKHIKKKLPSKQKLQKQLSNPASNPTAPGAQPTAAPAAGPVGVGKPKQPGKPKAVKGPVKPRAGRKPTQPKTGPLSNQIANPAGSKTASANIKVAGRMNGKPSKTIIHKGTSYSLVHTNMGVILKRPGSHGVFIVDSGDVGKL